MTGREFVGHTGQGHNAGSVIAPVVERIEDGPWLPLDDVRSLFPPDGFAEIKGVLATRLRADEWVIFQSVPGDRPRARFRAHSPRRLLPFLDATSTPAPDGLRRLMVEVGLAAAPPGECAVRVADGAVVAVTFARGHDARFRATGHGLASLSLRQYDDARIVQSQAILDGAPLYDFAGSPELGDVVDWSRDDEIMAAALRALSLGGAEVSRQLSSAVLGSTDPETGRVSALGAPDAGELMRLVRTGALADRLKAEHEALSSLEEALRADPIIQDRIVREATARVAAERPEIISAVRAEVAAEVEALRDSMMAEARSALGELEAVEMAALENRIALRRLAIDAEMAEALRLAIAEVEGSVEAKRAALVGEISSLDDRVRSQRAELASLDAQEAASLSRLMTLGDREREVLGRVEALSRVEADLSLRSMAPAGMVPRWAAQRGETALGLGEITEAATSIGLLTPAGIHAIVLLAVYMAAGEVPILHGDEAPDLVEIAAQLLSAGRFAPMIADPTMITFDDLWSRPGVSTATPLGAAATFASSDDSGSILCLVSQAERSGSRFWYPPLADAFRRGIAPGRLLACVSVSDLDAEESRFLQQVAFLIDARSAFDIRAVGLTPAAMERLQAEPTHLRRPSLAIDAVRMLGLLDAVGPIGPSMAMRLSRVHAAARLALDDRAADRIVMDLAASVAAKLNHGGPNLTVVGRTANA